MKRDDLAAKPFCFCHNIGRPTFQKQRIHVASSVHFIFQNNSVNELVLIWSWFIYCLPSDQHKILVYLDEVPWTPVAIRQSSIFFLPSFTDIYPVEKCVIPVAVTFIQVVKEAYALIKASWITVAEIAFHIHGFMVSVNLLKKNQGPCIHSELVAYKE